MDQTSDLPRNQNEAEEAHTERETQSSSSSSSSVTEEPVLPGTGSRYRDMFKMPEVPADQPAQNVAENPTNQNIDQPVVAPDIIQMGNVVAPEPAIKKRHIEENSNRTVGLFNMAKVVQVTEGNMSFETAKAFKLQAEDPNQKMSMLKIPIHAHGFSTSTYTPMECLNIDFIGPFPDGGYVLVIVDTFTIIIQKMLRHFLQLNTSNTV
jgi:hypothetical protein